MRPLLLLLATLLAACSPSQFGIGILERAATDAGFRAERAVDGPRTVAYLDSVRPATRGIDRPPVVLLHGFGGSALTTWRAQLLTFGAERRVVAPDLLWFGASVSTEPPSLDAQVAAVLAVLDHAGLARADIVGISYGGFVALQLLATAPERVGRLVIVDSPGPFFTEADQAAMLQRLGVPSAEDLFLPDTPEEVDALLAITSAEPRHVPRVILADLQRTVFSANREGQRGLLQDLVARRGATPLPALGAGHDPLVVWGELDQVFPVEIGHTLADALHARLEVIPGTAHAPCAEAPQAFDAAVLGHLDRPAAPAR